MGEKDEKKEEKQELTSGQELRLNLYYWLQALVAAIVVMILLFTFVGRVTRVDGSSMNPTLTHNDMMLVRSIGYTPEQGDIVVLTKESFLEDSIVKRVIAVGGQSVRIDYETSTVYVDGQALEEDYILEPMQSRPSSWYTEIDVPEGCVFVMGDNRNGSTDSRAPEVGLVDTRCIIGKVQLVLFPFQHFGIPG